LADDVRELFPGAVEVRLAGGDSTDFSAISAPRLGRDPTELFLEYLASRNVDDPALVRLFNELLAESHEA